MADSEEFCARGKQLATVYKRALSSRWMFAKVGNIWEANCRITVRGKKGARFIVQKQLSTVISL